MPSLTASESGELLGSFHNLPSTKRQFISIKVENNQPNYTNINTVFCSY